MDRPLYVIFPTTNRLTHMNYSEATRSGKKDGASISLIGLPRIHSLVHAFGNVCNRTLSNSEIWSISIPRLTWNKNREL